MKCNISDEIIFDYVDKTLDELSMLVMNEHIISCDTCKQKISKTKMMFYDLYLLENENIEISDELDDIYRRIMESNEVKKNSFNVFNFIETQKRIIQKQVAFIDYLPGNKLGKDLAGKMSRATVKATGSLLKQGYRYALSRR